MGAITFTIDKNLIRELMRHLPLEIAVESGTYKGDSLAILQEFFKDCLSIELSPDLYQHATTRFAHCPDVKLLLGDSAVMLREHRALFSQRSALFWLDAHWCAAENTAGEVSQCPLLGELEAIGELNPLSVILIDDARLFLTPPPKPHEISAWPDLEEVLHKLHRLSDRHALVCFNDILVFVPSKVLPLLRPYLHDHAVNLLMLADKARDYDALLEQAKQKDGQIHQLADEVGRLRAAITGQSGEIQLLRTTADERLEVIQKLDVSLTQARRTLAELGQDPAKASPDLTALTDEVTSLRIQLGETRRQLQQKHIQLGKLEQTLARYTGEGSLSGWQRLIERWQVRLAERTPHPLGKLQQYAARTLHLERFPRPALRTKWPRICLITPSYQQASFLEATICSVLDQNYPNLAYGVQDGGSTDGSADIITRYLPRLAHAESAPDQGQSDAIRRGFSKLYPESNDIMGWLNSDDLLMPGALHHIGAYFARHPEVDVIYGHRVVIDDLGMEIGRWFLPPHSAHSLPWFDLVPQETLFWRARCLEQVGGMDTRFQFALDWDLLLRFEHAALTIRRIPYFLGCFRMHSQQKTSTNIHTVGEDEMQHLRRRTHGRDVTAGEIQKHLEREIRRSAMIEWLHRRGVRY